MPAALNLRGFVLITSARLVKRGHYDATIENGSALALSVTREPAKLFQASYQHTKFPVSGASQRVNVFP